MFKLSTLLGGLLLVSTAAMVPVMAKAQNSGFTTKKLCVPGTPGCPTSNQLMRRNPEQKIPEGYLRNDPGDASNGGKTNKLPKVEQPVRRNLTCKQAKEVLRSEGFRAIRSLFCEGSHYFFRGRKNWRNYFIVVRKRDGVIVSASRM